MSRRLVNSTPGKQLIITLELNLKDIDDYIEGNRSNLKTWFATSKPNV